MSARVWKCRTHAHLFQGDCWHARCECGWATAFDQTEAQACDLLDVHRAHDCPLRVSA